MPKQPPRSVVLIDPDLLALVRARAEREGRSVKGAVARLLRAWVDSPAEVVDVPRQEDKPKVDGPRRTDEPVAPRQRKAHSAIPPADLELDLLERAEVKRAASTSTRSSSADLAAQGGTDLRVKPHPLGNVTAWPT